MHKHLSVRVPWHDNGWNGSVCKDPVNNASCLFLSRINEKKISGEDMSEMDEAKFPPCISERVNFMSPASIKRLVSHPYSDTNELYQDFKPTPLVLPPYSFAAIPFRWMMKKSKDSSSEVAEELEISAYDPDIEPDLGFPTTWVQDKRNQEVLLQTFFSAIKPEKSLCFI